MENGKKHEGISFKEKLKTLLEPSNLIKLVLVQQDELKRINMLTKHNRPKYYSYVENIYEHYIVNGLSKTYLYNLN